MQVFRRRDTESEFEGYVANSDKNISDILMKNLDRNIIMVVSNISAMGDFATWRATSDRDRFDLKSFEVKLRPEAPVDGLRPGMTVRW